MQTEYDVVQRFLFDQKTVRGEIVRLKASYQTILKQQPYPAAINEWLGEALAGAALLSSTIKFQGQLILQVQADGPLKLLVAHSTHGYHIRGLAQAVGHGTLGITIQPEQGEPYQGVVNLATSSLSTAIENYFHQSEQLATFLLLAADGDIAAGLLLQNMPAFSDTTYDYFWEHAVNLARTLTTQELLTLPTETILHRLYHEEDIMLFDADPVSFRCSCSSARSEQILRNLSPQEAEEMVAQDTTIVVTCEFCKHAYTFDCVDVARVFMAPLA